MKNFLKEIFNIKQNWFKITTFILTSCIGIFVLLSPALAHPGRTASDGCHYCRTNCSSWGVAYGERHCNSDFTFTWSFLLFIIIFGIIIYYFSRKK